MWSCSAACCATVMSGPRSTRSSSYPGLVLRKMPGCEQKPIYASISEPERKVLGLLNGERLVSEILEPLQKRIDLMIHCPLPGNRVGLRGPESGRYSSDNFDFRTADRRLFFRFLHGSGARQGRGSGPDVPDRPPAR